MMKKILIMVLLATVVLTCACAAGIRDGAGTGTSKGSGTGGTMSTISDITKHEWKLTEVHIGGQDTQFTRSSLPNELRDCFTIKFDGQMVSGTGAPNIYSAPYSTGDNQSIGIMMMRSTLMASIFESENLKEHDFFTYVKNSHTWRTIGEQMELLSKTTDNREVRLVFRR